MDMQALSTFRMKQSRQDATDREHKRAGAPIDPWWIVRTLKRGWKPLAGATAAGLLVGGIVALCLPSTWQAEALVVPDVEADPANPFAGQDALHEGAQLLVHPAVLTSVRDRVGGTGTIEALRLRVDAEADPESNSIRVHARSDSRTGASGLADILIEEFLAQRRSSEGDRLRERARVRRAELTAAEMHLAEARTEYD